jgi:hypothetical protein
MAEGLVSIIAKKRAAIVSKWFDFAVLAYPPDTAKFLQGQQDRFTNPVGSHTLKGIEALFDLLMGAADDQEAKQALDPIMRIRAVQGMAPSQAVAFVFALKQILRELFAREAGDASFAGQLSGLEARIERFGLLAFDVYMACREQVFELKANETRNRTFKAFERAGLVDKKAGQDPGA